MASDAISPYITTMTLFLFLLLLIQASAAADKESHTASNLPRYYSLNTKNGEEAVHVKRSNNMDFATRKHKTANSNTNTVHQIPPVAAEKSERFRARRSPLEPGGQLEKIFNDSAHEVPSGPNPISNR